MNGSESDSETDEGESNTFSFARDRKWKTPRVIRESPSKLCFSLKVGRGAATLFCLPDDAVDAASSTHHGQVQCCIDDGMLFSVAAFQGNPKTGYVCFQGPYSELWLESIEANPGLRLAFWIRLDPSQDSELFFAANLD